MLIAKLIAFSGGVFYLAVFSFMLVSSQLVTNIFSTNFGIQSRVFFAAIVAIAFLVAVFNFCYGFYVQYRDRYHEYLDGAFFYSLQFLIVPVILFIGLIVLFISL